MHAQQRNAIAILRIGQRHAIVGSWLLFRDTEQGQHGSKARPHQVLVCPADPGERERVRHGTVKCARRTRHAQHIAGARDRIADRKREVPDARIDRRPFVGVDPFVESHAEHDRDRFHQIAADDARGIRQPLAPTRPVMREQQPRRFEGAGGQHEHAR